jgi:hypothetical protein
MKPVTISCEADEMRDEFLEPIYFGRRRRIKRSCKTNEINTMFICVKY